MFLGNVHDYYSTKTGNMLAVTIYRVQIFLCVLILGGGMLRLFQHFASFMFVHICIYIFFISFSFSFLSLQIVVHTLLSKAKMLYVLYDIRNIHTQIHKYFSISRPKQSA